MEALYEQLSLLLGSVWIAFLVGLVIGWSWKPKWVSLAGRNKLTCEVAKCLDFKSLKSESPSEGFISAASLNTPPMQSNASDSWASNSYVVTNALRPGNHLESNSMSQQLNKELFSVVTEEDLKYLWKLVEMRDGGPSWIQMMDRSTRTMSYEAWRRDPKNGPPQYCTRTFFEDAQPELVRDFFWDDEFRPKWDDMLAHYSVIEECPTTGIMVVQWIRKFPFFCSDREYIIGRRIWEVDGSYYCVTKGVPCASVPRREKPRRVDLYYSSWCIQAVKSRICEAECTACEVTFFHYEDMGIPWEIAKLGVRLGMWGTVKKIEPGIRAYQKERAIGGALSQFASMAQICTKVNQGYLKSLDNGEILLEDKAEAVLENQVAKNITKALIVGGVIILACSLNHGLLGKVFVFGMGRKIANRGQRKEMTN